ncbi:hypothetical protein Zmor_028301 [Zophobas morio]|uniref:PiggyBac transposable element-derived protein domain-containing protein n=1 Tax=Zophobas morio TaxID=2755281 RepID=A0AA38M2X2_9CUCU|nr:hypothetical protein Zmor_028301 [Zophobas morio]
MVALRGQLSIKQYVKGKPQPWGIKMFALCGRSGMMYDFIIYQGGSTEFDQNILKKFGLGATVVFHLSQRIPQYYYLYFDNYFTTHQVLEILSQKDIYAAGTIRINRFKNSPLINDKEASKKTRGYSEEVVSQDKNVVLCKWVDNKSVVMALNFIGVGSTDEVKRRNKNEKKYITVPRPEVVKLYNHSMGGVDKMDYLLTLYRIFVKSRKWTL